MKDRFNNVPFAPKRWPFFYGWAVLGFGTIGLLASGPGQTIGVSTFTDHLIEAVGLTRDQLSLAYMCGTIGSALLLTHAGKIYDRVGARIMGTCVCMALGVVLAALSQCDRIADALARLTGISSSWLPFGVMLLGFFGLRFTGQGLVAMTSRNMIVKWFERRRGIALGVSGVFLSFGMSLMPRIFDTMIEATSWRGAWQIMALIIGIGVTLVALLFFRDNPEECGLTPDGDTPAAAGAEDGPTLHPLRQYTLSEARRTYPFWVYALTIAIFGLYVTGLIFHIVSVFEEAGMDKEAAVAIFLPASVVSVCVRLAGGWISDHVRLKYMLMAGLCGLVFSIVGFVNLGPGWAVWLIIVGNGMSIALIDLLAGMVWPRYYGRTHLGAINGQVMAMVVFASALGPIIFSQSLTLTGSYQWAGWACLAVVVGLLAGACRARNPQGRSAGSDR